ncbi:metallophosphoesterase [Pseudomonas sp. FP1742]|uniref:metallophosphoesterase n=1 Tax=Pseudomonas sp. FP1742 TaxID=2954079 RepID=UPI0027369371|nr:metallophosphoesterase [Pseudomonas sp. FP1742]WLG48264.1 metallophosphoesterase [Pseudomonas sp. FP1742]
MKDQSIEFRAGAGQPVPIVMPHSTQPSTSNSRIELYTQEAMVNWLGPVQLGRTGLQTAVATTIGAFADPREVLAMLNPRDSNPPIQVAADGDVWIDYLADTGDGWDSTYSMALCVSQDVKLPELTLPRGDVLLLGGDQVYPTPARSGYRTRFLDPFRAAFPAPVPKVRPAQQEQSVPQPGAPWIVATPGNHDWYDGLRGFSQLFCEQKPIGGWETRQRTSYYVLQLANGWWIWGLDLQLESLIDRQQKQYFEEMRTRLQPGDRVILCTPEPSWVDEAERLAREDKALSSIETQTPRFRSLREIEQLLGDHLAVVLAGDSHHYARYQPKAGSQAPQRITCGGGGAFLHGTHQLPDPPEPINVGGTRQRYELAGVYPDKKTSEQLRNRAWRLPTHNLPFCGMLAILYLLFDWMIQSASKIPHPARGNRSLMEVLSDFEVSIPNIREVWRQLFLVLAHSPSSVMFAVTIVLGCAVLSAAGVKRTRKLAYGVGAVHGLLHLGLAIGLLWLMGRVNIHYLQFEVENLLQVLLFLVGTLLLGGSLGGLLFGSWMVMGNTLWGLHSEVVFSSQRIADHKCFLRMHFKGDQLTIYPLKLEKVCRRWSVATGVAKLAKVQRTWRLRATPESTGPRFVPATGELELRLIEPPIEIRRARTTP